MKKIREFGLGVLGGFVGLLLFAFTTQNAPSRSPIASLTSQDSIFVMDSSLGGASAGIPNVTGKIITCDGTTALAYDAVTSHSFSCLSIETSNVDAGAPFGSVDVFSGYNALGTAATDKIAQVTYFPIVRALDIGFTVEVAGVGAGTFTVEAFDATGSVSLCTSAAINCAAVAGTITNTDCKSGGGYVQTSAVKHDVLLRANCTGCTTCPSGNAYAEMQTILGS